MLKYIIIILLYQSFIISTTIINNDNQEVIPKEIIHGAAQNETWEIGKYYEYYLDISNYALDEENIFEIYGVNIRIDPSYINLYFLFTDISDVELIKNGTIKPNTEEDTYPIGYYNKYYDSLTYENYLFIPFTKSSSSHNYLIILIENIEYQQIQASFYISKRIPMINIERRNPNNADVYSKEIEVRDDFRLYYKIDLDKIDLVKNNVYVFINKTGNEDMVLEVNYFNNLSSLRYYDYNLFILEKNTTNISEISIGIKRKNNYNNEKKANLSIRIDNNDIYSIQYIERENTKMYVENLKCDKYVFIIEDYLEYDTSNYKYITFDRLYGNYIIKYYKSIKDLNFEKFYEETEKDISNLLVPIEDLVNVYILKCITPSAFYLEIFSESDTPHFMDLGKTIKTILKPSYYYSYVNFYYLNVNHKYHVNVRILDESLEMNRTLKCIFYSQRRENKVQIIEPEYEYTETYYADQYDSYYPYIGLKTDNYMFLEYFFTSNHLISNIAEGRTIIDKNPTSCALKIRKDNFFDYINIEAECVEDIIGYYELRLINNENIEEESNALMVGLPQIWMPFTNSVKLKISNPYDKYNQIADINQEDNYFYLLFHFLINVDKPVYLNIGYNYNDQMVMLNKLESKIIVPETEYEFFSYDSNYEVKDKILININKCSDFNNYTLINYYENSNNIIKETQILDSHQLILLDNIHYKSKFILKKESEEEKNDSIINPAEYYNKGDILLNYFLIESSILKELKFTSDFNISYKDEVWYNITISWKKYVYIESNNKKSDLTTNYSIYILPKNSIVNTICQLSLIPSNKSVINHNEITIELEEGEYKVAIIARVIDKEMPFEIMYDIMELNVIKRINVTLIVILSISGFIIILLVLFFIFRKKIFFSFKIRRLSQNIEESDIKKDEMEYDLEEENQSIKKQNSLAEELIKMINKE